MIMLGEGEKLRRRYPGDLKGYGQGTLYVTGGRLAFETEKHGLVMDIAFKYMMDWNVKGKRTLAFRWQEPPVRGADAQLADPMFDAEVDLGRKDGKRCDPEEAKLALTLAYVEHFPYGVEGMGFYTNERGELRNHFDASGRVYADGFDPETRWMAFCATAWQDLVRWAGGNPEKVGDPEEYVRKHGGKTLIEQEMFGWLTMKYAQQADGTFAPYDGLATPAEMSSYGKEGGEIGHYEWAVENATKNVRECEEKVAKYRAKGNTKELERFWPPAPAEVEYVHKWPGGTEVDNLKHTKDELVIVKRTLEILRKCSFEFQSQYEAYQVKIRDAVARKVMAGEDVSTYVPEFAKIKSAIPATKEKIEEFRKHLVEAV